METVLCKKLAWKCFYACLTEGEYLAIDNDGNMRVNSLRSVIVVWLSREVGLVLE